MGTTFVPTISLGGEIPLDLEEHGRPHFGMAEEQASEPLLDLGNFSPPARLVCACEFQYERALAPWSRSSVGYDPRRLSAGAFLAAREVSMPCRTSRGFCIPER